MHKKVLFVSNSKRKFVNNHILDAFIKRDDLSLNILHLLDDGFHESILDKILIKLKIPPNYNNINESIISAVRKFRPDIVFVVKGNSIYPWTLRKIKKINCNIKLVSWSLDDMYAMHNRSLYYSYGLKFYDHVFTTKSYNISELALIGAKDVHFLYQAYSTWKHLNKDINAIRVPKRDVSFIGHAEKERFNSILHLAKHGIKVNIAGGGGWNKKTYTTAHKNISFQHQDLHGQDYCDFIAESKINLCFLRKINRDLHTSRSIEIPASGGFMIAERTNEHETLFEDKKEAVYFNDNDDLLKNIQYYLSDKNEKERYRILKNGHQRCLINNYSYEDMVERILSVVA
jgi:spore maturation protein CgeB